MRDETPKTRYVGLRISPEEYEYIKDKADALGKGVSETIRIMLNQWRILMENPFFSLVKETDIETVVNEPLVAYVKGYTELKREFGEKKVMVMVEAAPKPPGEETREQGSRGSGDD